MVMVMRPRRRGSSIGRALIITRAAATGVDAASNIVDAAALAAGAPKSPPAPRRRPSAPLLAQK